jgi:tellurite resistance protein
MLEVLEKLAAPEVETLSRAPLLVCILIAGADNKIDDKEIKGAVSLASKRKGKSKDSLGQFYDMIAEDFEDKFKIVMQAFPSETKQRNALLSEELGRLNKILPKIDKAFAKDYYQCLLRIARKIAESSGGLLGMNAVGEEEDKLVGLPMIKNPSTA